MTKTKRNKKSGWQDKFKDYAKVGVVIAIVFWIFSIANGAQQLAIENKKIVQKPKYKISYVAGGPKRFKEEFKNYLEDTDKKIETNQYLWSTIIVKNTGGKKAKEVKIKDKAAIEITQIGVSEPGWGYTEAEVSYNKKKQEAIITLKELEVGEKIYAFIAMNPSQLNKPYNLAVDQKWAGTYRRYQDKITVKSNLAKRTLYGNGYASLYK
ncbi:hypothetical protein Halha_0402 [Halobacteroides halobius DSM 5150]|uniref:Uncharacterized protein n=1 Tax=Halobacteroides halobius (strain ATCC 35273 / DSM 5150 / MD-1) TaxID=748449 RepID=L0K561_HALHC|nr:hypothetical protein [Halobacteroides halobius]AGB40397.1 hypothetical protein Halha_0402 [Halobacteroides halobius DSM 5150]